MQVEKRYQDYILRKVIKSITKTPTGRFPGTIMAEIKKRSDYFKRTKLFEPFQPNPTEVIGKGTKGDCVIRALCAVLGLDWRKHSIY